MKTFSLPLEDDLLRNHDFFDLYPMDGGGRFSFQDMFGTIRDGLIADRVFGDGELPGAGRLPYIDFKQFERWRVIEKSCGLNRFYFLPPLAKSYWLGGDEEKAVLIKDTILHFIRKHPPPHGKEETGSHISRVLRGRDLYNSRSYSQNQADESDVEYIWFDFQPASRIIHLIYCAYFLSGSQSISPEEWEEIRAGINAHARTIFTGEEYFLGLKQGNHQSLRGLALLLAGCFFKKSGAGEDYLRKGIEICNFHIENDFLPDGVLREISPSYHVFETWHMRDAYFLSRKHGFDLTSRLEEKLEKSAVFINSISGPDSRTAVLNDGYSIDAGVFLKTLPFSGKPENNFYFFRDAGIGVYKDNLQYFIMDASPFGGPQSHYHGGKNAVTYWHGKNPVLIDSGCCGYDDELFSWYKQSAAHSSLIADETPDSVNSGTYAWESYAFPGCSGWETVEDGLKISSRLTSGSPGWEDVLWERSVIIREKGGAAISDKVSLESGKTLDFIFNLHPGVKPRVDAGGVVLDAGGEKYRLRFSCEEEVETIFLPGRCFIDFKHEDTIRVIARVKASSDILLKTVLASETSPPTRKRT